MAENFLSRILRRIGQTANPLFDPHAEARRSREAATRRAVESLASTVDRLGSAVERVTARVDKVDRRQIEQLRAAVDDLEWGHRRQMAFADRLLRRAHPQAEREFVRERVLRRLRALSRSDRPVIVGPWTGEVGFELLYWVPFVRWAVKRFDIDPGRIVLISRGGTKSWYGLTEPIRYVDVLERRTTDELRGRMAEAKKQRTIRLFDRRLIREVAAEVGGAVDVLHPSWMYSLYMPYWKQSASIRWAADLAAFSRITPPTIEGLHLPVDYVAVRFYFSDCFPDTPENRAIVTSVVASVGRDRDVVLLGSGVSVDEHRDAPIVRRSPRVHTVDHLVQPANNLAVQTAVIAGASAFVGTYGGFSYLAPMCGVNTVALYSLNNYYEHHLDFAQQMFTGINGGSLTVVDTSMRELIGQIARSDAPQ